MSLSLVGTATASGTSVTIPAHQPGDLLLIWAMRGASTTAPSLPAGWYSLLTKSNSTATSCAAVLGYRVATGAGAVASASQNTTTGVWTTATNSLVAGQVVQITGTLPGGFSANTNYYVLPTNLTSTTCELSTTAGGSVKIPTSSASTTLDTDPSGTWTNANEICCHVYRPSSGYTAFPGKNASSSSTTATVTYPALTLADSSGNSWVAGFVAAGNIAQTISTAPTGMTNESSVVGTTYAASGHDTEGGVASWSSTTANVGTSGSTVSAVVEIMLMPKTSGISQYIYQHVTGGGNPYPQGQPGNAYKLPLHKPSGAGNTILLEITYDGGATVSSVLGSVNGSFGAPVKTALNGSGVFALDTAVYMLQNIAAGQETVTVTFSATVQAFTYCITELYGVATSGGIQGSSSVAGSPTIGAGSFTPTNNDASGGNLILAYFCKSDETPAKNTQSIVAGSNFTLLGANIAFNETNGYEMAYALEGYAQTTAAAINPTVVVPWEASGDNWNSVAIALKISSGSGTAPASGIQIEKIDHFSTINFPSSTTGLYVVQCPAVGNLRVIASDDPSLHTLTVWDSEGNVWDNTAGSAGIFFLKNASANPNLRVYIQGGGGDVTLSWRYIDISGADPNPYDSFVNSNQTITSLTSFTASPSPSPTSSSGLTIAAVGLGQGPGKAVTAPTGAIWTLCTYTGELDTDLIENADILAHYPYSASGAQTWTFSITSNNPNSTSGGFISFKAASGSVTGSGAITEGADTVSGTGLLSVSGSAAITENTDAVSGTGAQSVIGTSAITEGADSVSATGAVSSAGTAAINEGADAIAASGGIGLSGSASIIESSDTVSASGNLELSGAASIVEGADIASATGALSVIGSASITESADSVSAIGALSVIGSASIVEGLDTVSATGSLSVSGSASIIESADSVSASGLLGGAGAAIITEQPDAVSASGALAVSGMAAIIESGDIVSAAGALSVSGSATITEGVDAVVANGIAGAAGGASIIENADGVSASGTFSITGIASILEANDAVNGAGALAVTGIASIIENGDLVSASGYLGKLSSDPRYIVNIPARNFTAVGANTFTVGIPARNFTVS